MGYGRIVAPLPWDIGIEDIVLDFMLIVRRALSRVDAGDCLGIGERAMKSRISVGVYRNSADSRAFSRCRLLGRFF